MQYGIDAGTGKVAPLDPINAMPPEGTGPRHLASHPSGEFVYASNEQRPGASVYQRLPNGQLKHVQVCDAFAKKPRESGLSSSDIQCTPDGRFVFVGIRDRDKEHNAIARYKVNEDKSLTFGPTNNALAFFAFRLLSRLQACATVPAVDWSAYASQLSKTINPSDSHV